MVPFKISIQLMWSQVTLKQSWPAFFDMFETWTYLGTSVFIQLFYAKIAALRKVYWPEHSIDLKDCCGTTVLLQTVLNMSPTSAIVKNATTTIITTNNKNNNNKAMPVWHEMSIFVKAGGCESQTAILLKQNNSWHPGDLSFLIQCWLFKGSSEERESRMYQRKVKSKHTSNPDLKQTWQEGKW